jgi:hypothetical protein
MGELSWRSDGVGRYTKVSLGCEERSGSHTLVVTRDSQDGLDY